MNHYLVAGYKKEPSYHDGAYDSGWWALCCCGEEFNDGKDARNHVQNSRLVKVKQ